MQHVAAQKVKLCEAGLKVGFIRFTSFLSTYVIHKQRITLCDQWRSSHYRDKKQRCCFSEGGNKRQLIKCLISSTYRGELHNSIPPMTFLPEVHCSRVVVSTHFVSVDTFMCSRKERGASQSGARPPQTVSSEESLSPESASLRVRHGQRDQRESRRPSSPFSGDARLELRQQELVVEAVDGGDVGEDARDHVLRDSSLCELSAKYLRRKKKNVNKVVYKHSKSGSGSWSRHANTDGEVSMLLIHVNGCISCWYL